MSIEWIEKDAKVLRHRIHGKMSESDMTEAQQALVVAVGKFGRVRGLVILDDFEGWEDSEKWGDLTFQQEHDREIERIAVVGEERWRDEILAFLVAPFRSADVRYFGEHELDRANDFIAE